MGTLFPYLSPHLCGGLYSGAFIIINHYCCYHRYLGDLYPEE